jgi:hypothetical protein
MPVRFRQSFNLLPGVKVNMSKGGMSLTAGTKGFHLNFSKRGVRQTIGLPGSGISESSYLFKTKLMKIRTIKRSALQRRLKTNQNARVQAKWRGSMFLPPGDFSPSF